jgi:hypothetical protein
LQAAGLPAGVGADASKRGAESVFDRGRLVGRLGDRL